MKYLAAYGIALAIFLILDAIWLGLLARGLYMSRIGDLILDQPLWTVAGLFYLIYVAGLVYFGVSTGMNGGGPLVAAMNGALFGFFAYITYDLTNLSTMKGFDPVVATVDIAWGTLLGGIVSYLTVVSLSALGLVGGD